MPHDAQGGKVSYVTPRAGKACRWSREIARHSTSTSLITYIICGGGPPNFTLWK